jgi:TRAP-type C4-dicarboxylate transport system permease small subunit
VVVSVVLALALHVGVTYSAGLGAILHVEPLDFELFLMLIPIALGLMAIMEIYKVTRARRRFD